MGFLDDVLDKQNDAVATTEPTIEPSSPGEPLPPIVPTEPVTEPAPAGPGIPTDPGNPATGGPRP
ncbi:MAG: hypothetical protein JWN68_134 [Nocardioides sp.]|uniref:hypothetical protein n=1 Tax=Nocardioides sp. TaxID=35761 RepID=UPI0026366416|nr:hypothetical protein [Nocardioides sp.]MCW2832181.1 hypothetical protein [Nocardioides sp.]